MPEQNNSEPRKRKAEQNATLIIPHVTDDMIQKARRMMEAGASRAEVEKALRTMQAQEAERQRAAQEAAAQQQAAAQKQEPAPQPAPQPALQPRHRVTRAEAEQQLAERIRSDHIWLSNPMLVRGLGLAPAICAALDVDRALMLCAAALVLVTFTRVVAVAVCHLTHNRARMPVYLYTAALLYIPTYLMMYALFGTDVNLLGIYLPILVVEPAVLKRMEFTELESVQEAARHGLNNALGLCLSLLAVGALRELLAFGTLHGQPVLQVALLPLAAQPAGGFVIVGLLAAVWMASVDRYTRYKKEEVRRLYADRKR